MHHFLSILYSKLPFLWKCRLTLAAYQRSKEFSTGFHLDKLRNYYSEDNSTNKEFVKGAIVMLDGRYYHGGLADRLRGLLSVYSICEKYNCSFYINWVYPFSLLDYLIPNEVNWSVKPSQISYNSNISLLCVVDTLSNIIAQDYLHKHLLNKTIKSKYQQKHIYSDAFIDKKKYPRLFKKLFKPSDLLKTTLEKINSEIGGKYISFSFRFLSLLGDFEDTEKKDPVSDEKKNEIMSKCKKELIKQISNVPSNYKIVLFSDSKTFLNFVKDVDCRIYIIPGEITHMDIKQKSNDSHLKTFVDFFTIMNAYNVNLIRTNEMYKSGFPLLAAILGEKPFHDILIK